MVTFGQSPCRLRYAVLYIFTLIELEHFYQFHEPSYVLIFGKSMITNPTVSIT